jgi:hypothetical protein
VFRDLLFALIVVALATHAVSLAQPPQQPSGNESAARPSPSNQSPGNQSAPQPQDPAAVVFTTDVGMVLHAVKPASATDYELAVIALKEALATADDEDTQKLAGAWRIYKATETDAKSSVIYVHVLDPVVPGLDYRPSLWLDKLLNGAPAELLSKYRDAFAAPPTKLSLTAVQKPQ